MAKPWKFIIGLTIGAFGLAMLLQLVAIMMRPDISQNTISFDTDELAAVKALHQQPIDKENPPVLYQSVDYTVDNTQQPWFPQAQSPILDDIDLPPVAERTGSEPLVLRGIDGAHSYGGQLYLPGDGFDMSMSMSATTLVRWSPAGEPVVPHAAKSFSVSEDGRIYEFVLRRGMRWSDGEPFTTDDIKYWYEYELLMPDAMAEKANAALFPGNVAVRMEFDDDKLTFRFIFEEPQGLFLYQLARSSGRLPISAPAHYLRTYHPIIGDEAVISRAMTARNSSTRNQLYKQIKHWDNPAHPRLWPWIYKTYKADPPQQVVRNPYYWAVDPHGQQLPYADAVFFEQLSSDMLGKAASEGRFSVLPRKVNDYELLMSNRQQFNYNVFRWFRADRSDATIFVNLNRRWRFPEYAVVPVDQALGKPIADVLADDNEQILIKPETVLQADHLDLLTEQGHSEVRIIASVREDAFLKAKADLLRNKQFRRAMSLAINRQRIITAVYQDETEPAQVAPGPESAWYHPGQRHAAIAFAPDEAEQLLDDLGLVRGGSDNMRRLPDGTPLHFILNAPSWFNPATAQFLAEDWQRVGLNISPRIRNNKLFYTEKTNLLHDFTAFTGNNEYLPILEPRCFVPVSGESNHAIGYANWFNSGGLKNHPLSYQPRSIAPDASNETGHAILQSMHLYQQIRQEPDPSQQKILMDQILDIAAEHIWTISICQSPDYVVAVDNDLRNIPRRAFYGFDFIAPGNMGPETWSFVDPSANLSAQSYDNIQATIANPPTLADGTRDTTSTKQTDSDSDVVSSVLGWLISIAAILSVTLIAVKHPFIARRLLIMVPTLVVISIVVFTIIQIPPGTYIDSKIMELEQQGGRASSEEVAAIREQYNLDDPVVIQYVKWSGLAWFTSFAPEDRGVLQGFLGYSMAAENQ